MKVLRDTEISLWLLLLLAAVSMLIFRIAFDFPVQFKEQEAASMEINDVQVEHADLEDFVGIKTELTDLREGMRIFRVPKWPQ